MYCGGILAFPADLSSGISAIRTSLDYKWTPEIVKTRTFMLKRAKTVTSVCCFTKRTPRLRPEWLKMLGTNLTRPKNGSKALSWPKNQSDRELTQGRNILSLIKNILSREYSLTGNGIFLFCQENILSLLDDVADDMAMWTRLLMTWMMTQRLRVG
jgi:hypothetical protein